MRRSLVGLGLLVGILGASPAWPSGSNVRSDIVVCTATRSHLVTASGRRDLLVQNVGTLHVNVGRGSKMLTLHVDATLSITDYQGGLDCQTQAGTGSTAVEILEVLR